MQENVGYTGFIHKILFWNSPNLVANGFVHLPCCVVYVCLGKAGGTGRRGWKLPFNLTWIIFESALYRHQSLIPTAPKLPLIAMQLPQVATDLQKWGYRWALFQEQEKILPMGWKGKQNSNTNKWSKGSQDWKVSIFRMGCILMSRIISLEWDNEVFDWGLWN